MEYSKMLKYFLGATGLRLKDVAQATHYDTSYISKWINGHNVPVLDQSREIHNALSVLLTEEIKKKDLVPKIDLFKKIFYPLDSDVNIYLAVFNLINEAYIASYTERNKDTLNLDEGRVVAGYKAIEDFLYLIFSLTPVQHRELDVYVSLDMSLILTYMERIKELVLFASSRARFNSITSSSAEVFKEVNKATIMEVLNEVNYYDVNIYLNENHRSANYLYIADNYVLFFEMDVLNKPMLLTYTKDPEVLEHMDRIARRDFTESSIIVKTVYEAGFETQLYQYSIYANNTFNYFVSFPNAYFMEEELARELMEANRIDENERQGLVDLVRLQNHAINTIHYNVIINLDYYLQQIVKREVAIGTKTLTMTNAQHERYIRKLVEGLRNDTRNEYYMINAFGLAKSNWRFNNNIFCTDHLYCIKKPHLTVRDEHHYNYVYSSDNNIKEDLIKLSSLVEDDRYLIPNGHAYLASLIEAAVSADALSEKQNAV